MNDLISRQAAIRWVKTECNPYGKPTLEFESGKRVIAHLEQLPSAQQWIPCSERLPCDDGRYLVSYWLMKDMPWISVMYYGKPTFPEKDHPCFYVSDGEYGDVEYDDIVAWMPLPEPFRKTEPQTETPHACKTCPYHEQCSAEDWRSCRYDYVAGRYIDPQTERSGYLSSRKACTLELIEPQTERSE